MLHRLIVTLLLPVAGLGQVYLNLGFEAGSGVHPVGWFFPICSGYDIQQVTSVAHSGRQSLRIAAVIDTMPPFPCQTRQNLPLELVRGKHIRLSGYIKTEIVALMATGLFLSVYGYNGRAILTEDGPYEVAPKGSTDWYPFVINRDVSPDASSVIFGAMVIGNGTVYFDDLKIEIDGVPIPQPPDALGRPLTTAENDWLLRNSIRFTTSDPSNQPPATPAAAPLALRPRLASDGDFSDLQPIKEWIGDAHFIGIGESTHGTHEFSQMKHRMLEFLVAEMGVTIFAVEANMPEAYRINEYVLTGKGDPKELLKGMYFWTTNTQEMLDLIQWMRAYNESGRGPVQFTGFDLQYAPVAMDNVRAFVTKNDPEYLSRLNTLYAQVADAQNINGTDGPRQLAAVQSAVDAADQVIQHLDSSRAAYAEQASAAGIEWIVQNARIARQATYGRTGDPDFRDIAMAQNAEWILRQAPPGAKILLWAHDGHIRKRAGWMGGYLAMAHGQDYFAISQLFHAGRYNARLDDGQSVVPPVRVNTADSSELGSLEFAMHATGVPRLILNLRKASPSEPDSAWLLGGLQVRSIGAFAQTSSFYLTFTETQDFDAVIFFDQTSPTELLPF